MNQDQSQEEPCVFPQRYIIGILGFAAMINAYIERFSTSLAITEMASTIYHNSTVNVIECPGGSANGTFIFHDREFDWDEQTQGLILSSVFWGYVLTQLPGGMLAERLGPKHVLGCGMLLSIFGYILTPVVVRTTGAYGFIVIRFIVGFGQGPIYPSLNVLLSHWAPVNERGRLGSLVFAGAQVGNIVSMALSGILIKMFGWTSIFYVYGCLGIIWYILWILLAADHPSDSRYISEAEMKYLAQTVTEVVSERKDLQKTPWKGIFTSPAVYALIIAQIGHDWGLFTIITDLPKYMKTVLHYSVAENGLLSALPYVLMWISAIVSGVISDWLIEKKGWKITVVRKLFITVASVGPALGIMLASYSNCDRTLVAISFTVGMGFMGAFVSSLKVNTLDLSPNYAGTLMAIVGGIGAISGIFAPYLVGVMTTNGTLLEWRKVFWVSFFMLVGTNMIYLLFGSANVQPWNEQTKSLSLSSNNNDKITELKKIDNSEPVTNSFSC